jgi:hypothetical protein
VVKEILEKVHAKGEGSGPKEEVGQVLYMRGAMSAMLAVEGVRRAQERFGKGKWVSGEQARWGYENLALDQKKLDALGFAGVMRPISTTCADHMGSNWARVHTWDGKKWNFSSDWLQADEHDPQAIGQGHCCQVRGRQEADTAHASGLPELELGTPPGLPTACGRFPPCRGQHQRPGKAGSAVFLEGGFASHCHQYRVAKGD